jgi:hypothetical protein
VQLLCEQCKWTPVSTRIFPVKVEIRSKVDCKLQSLVQRNVGGGAFCLKVGADFVL